MVVDLPPVAQGADDPPPAPRCPDCATPLLAIGQAWTCGTCRRAGLIACCRWCSLTAWIPGGHLGTLPHGWAQLVAGNRVEVVCSAPHAAALLDLLTFAGVLAATPPPARRTGATS